MYAIVHVCRSEDNFRELADPAFSDTLSYSLISLLVPQCELALDLISHETIFDGIPIIIDVENGCGSTGVISSSPTLTQCLLDFRHIKYRR